MRYLSVFLVLLYVFSGVACLVICGTKNAFLASIIIISSSHNIIASLCCCSVNHVDHFIAAIAIMSYDYKLTLNTIVKKLFVVSTCKP